ncbi:MAG: hypothetical protein V1809_01970 [Planctomycetota bacterium]
MAPPGSIWRIYDIEWGILAMGDVDAAGRLAGLPDVLDLGTWAGRYNASNWICCAFLMVGCLTNTEEVWQAVEDEICDDYAADYFRMAVRICGEYVLTWQDILDLPVCPAEDWKSCPRCGYVVGASTEICGWCGYEFDCGAGRKRCPQCLTCVPNVLMTCWNCQYAF